MTVNRSRASRRRVTKGAGGHDTDDRIPVIPEVAEPVTELVEEVPLW